MSLTIPVAHDFTCGWCWIGLSQIHRMRAEFDVKFDWRAYELFPAHLIEPPDPPVPPLHPNRPKTPSRMQLALAAEGIKIPKIARPADVNTAKAHEAVEFAKQFEKHEQLIERIYKAYWESGLDIGQLETLKFLATGLLPDLSEMLQSIEDQRFKSKITYFNDGAYESGVWNVPTFWIGGERYAEQPYRVLADAICNAISLEPS